MKKEIGDYENNPDILLEECLKTPMADVLVGVFKSRTNEQTQVLRAPSHYRHQLAADVKDPGINGSIGIECFYDDVVLRFYNCPASEINLVDEGHVSHIEFASFRAGPKITGTWAYGKGDQFTYNISWRISDKYLSIPSRGAAWFFGVATQIALTATELHDSVDRQPRFWKPNK